MAVNLDLHVHTDASHDCSTSVEEAIEYAEEQKHLDGVAITDHDSVANHEKALKLAEDSEITVILGTEISTADGHILGLNIREKIEPGLSLEESIRKVREKGGIAIIPHPFQYFRHGVKKDKLESVDPDAIEVFNSRLITGLRNYQSDRYAQMKGYPKVAGSDAHVPELIGTTYTIIDAENESPEEIINAISNGNTELHRKKTPIISYIRQILTNNWRTSL